MTESMFLSPAELVRLTGRSHARLQIEALRAMGVAFYINAVGRPVVAKVAIEGRATDSATPAVSELPEDLAPFEGMAPLAWLRANWARFDFSADTIEALAEPFPSRTERRFSGIYFLVHLHRIEYVGLSNHVGRRLVEHRKYKTFSHVFAFQAPDLVLPHIEAHYIDTLSPPMNLTRAHQRARFHSAANTHKRIFN